jgi:hypothetical protein
MNAAARSAPGVAKVDSLRTTESASDAFELQG